MNQVEQNKHIKSSQTKHAWTDGCFNCSVENVSEQTLKNYSRLANLKLCIKLAKGVGENEVK